MSVNFIKNGVFLFGMLLLSFCSYGQEILDQGLKSDRDTTTSSKIIVKNADSFRGVTQEEELIKYLNGNVSLYQDSTFMYCDSAVLEANQLTAFGNVVIIQNDSISVFSDSLVYDGDLKIARLYRNVILQNNEQQLFTEFLIYDLNSKVGSYTTGALLKNEKTEIKSLVGKYFVNEKEVRFYKNVSIVNENFKLWTDSLKYDYENDIAHFLAPTRIDQENSKIYCEGGYYDMKNEDGEFRINAQYIQDAKTAFADVINYNAAIKKITLAGNANYSEEDKVAKGDTIIYFEETEETELIGNASYEDDDRSIVGEHIKYNAKTESFNSVGRSTIVDSSSVLTANSVEFLEESDLGVAYGDVILLDTASRTTIESEAMFYKKDSNYSKAYNPDGTRPLLYSIMEGDSFFLRSDTLLSSEITDTIGTKKTFLNAFNNVKIFKSNLQASCDSLSYNTTDSIISMFDSPVIWSDSSQFSADTIDIVLRNDEIYKIYLRNKGFIINTKDSFFFNQIKGKLVEVFFVDGNMDSMSVVGNSESIYFMLDEEDAYIGMNKSISSSMSFTFEENDLKDIYFDLNVNSNLTPIQDVDPRTTLEGFNWQDKERPKNKNEL